MDIPNWTVSDFKIKQTATGYSVYYTHDEKSRCLRSHLRELKQAESYITWLIKFRDNLSDRTLNPDKYYDCV